MTASIRGWLLSMMVNMRMYSPNHLSNVKGASLSIDVMLMEVD